MYQLSGLIHTYTRLQQNLIKQGVQLPDDITSYCGTKPTPFACLSFDDVMAMRANHTLDEQGYQNYLNGRS
jgi:hypothetical protein